VDDESSSKLLKESRNKYAFDPDLEAFTLKKVLLAGMAFPYDFGFVPSREADDSDPVDVLVLMDEPSISWLRSELPTDRDYGR
jgi:inorganic pyrophosphatase